MEKAVVIVDTSVLLNFILIDRLDLLANHPGYRFAITNHVRAEVSGQYPKEVQRLESSLQRQQFEEIVIDGFDELKLFAELHATKGLGYGECSAIAGAVHRGLALAIEDRTARNHAQRLFPKLQLIDTEGLIVSLIRSGVLNVSQADVIKDDWETNHRFALKFRSFREKL